MAPDALAPVLLVPADRRFRLVVGTLRPPRTPPEHSKVDAPFVDGVIDRVDELQNVIVGLHGDGEPRTVVRPFPDFPVISVSPFWYDEDSAAVGNNSVPSALRRSAITPRISPFS